MLKSSELRIVNYVEGIGMEEPIRKILDTIGYNYETEKREEKSPVIINILINKVILNLEIPNVFHDQCGL